MSLSTIQADQLYMRFPRSRGDEPAVQVAGFNTWKVFPAHAGMSLFLSDTPTDASSFPRSRGDEPAGLLINDVDYLFSPLTRG